MREVKKVDRAYWGAFRTRDGEIAAGKMMVVDELGSYFIQVWIPDSEDVKRCFNKHHVTHIVRCSEKDARIAAAKLLTGKTKDFTEVNSWMNGRSKLKG